MANPSGVFKYIERADEAVKKKNWDYAVSNCLEVLRQKPDDGETRKKLFTCCRERCIAGQVKKGPLDALLYLPLRKTLIALGVLLLLVLVAFLGLGGTDEATQEVSHLGWYVSLALLALAGGFSAVSPWPRLLLWKHQGKADKAFALATQLLLKEPNHVDLLDFQAEIAQAAGHPDAAIAICEWILGFMPDHIPTLRIIGGLTHQHRKDVTRAQQYYNRILQITNGTDLDASRAIKNLAAEHTMQQGVEAAAVSGSYRAMLKDTKTAEKLEDQQRTLKTADEVQRAIGYKKEEIGKKPDDWKLWRDLGDLHKRLKAWADAEAAYNKAIALEPVNPTLKMSLGNLTLTRHDEQVASLKASLKANPADADAKGRLSQAEKARWQFAAQEFAWRAAEYPTDANVRFEYGDALYRLGKVREAIAEFQFSVKDHKRKLQSLLRLGECFRREGQMDLAAKQYEKAVEDMPTMNETRKVALYALGDVYEKQGRLPEAKKAWDELYEADINFRDVTKRLEALGARLKAG